MSRTKLAQKEKEAKWWRERNARRREQYQTDKEYRKNRQEKSREWWRQNNSVGDGKSCLENQDKLYSIGEIRTVYFPDGDSYWLLCFTLEELADALGGYAKQVMYRWCSQGQLPHPVYQADAYVNSFGRKRFPTKVNVFLEDEVRAIMEVLGPHQKVYRQYRTSHTSVISAIQDAVDKVREDYGQD